MKIKKEGARDKLTLCIDRTKQSLVKIFETNVGGVSDVTQAFLPLLRKRGQDKVKTRSRQGQDKVKKIVNISSILGSISAIQDINPTGRSAGYCISKTAVNMLTKITSLQLAKENFIVYAQHPGWVKTDMGGDDAPVEQVDSIKGMLKVVDSVTPEETGSYFNYTGDKLNW